MAEMGEEEEEEGEQAIYVKLAHKPSATIFLPWKLQEFYG